MMSTANEDIVAEDARDRSFVRAEFGRRVRELRRQRGHSQERFAALSGLDRSYYGSVERGERNISLDNISAIARALEVPIRELFASSESRT